jgi:hypothetical protein
MSKDKVPDKGPAVRIRDVLLTSLEANLAPFKPVEIITFGSNKYLGI